MDKVEQVIATVDSTIAKYPTVTQYGMFNFYSRIGLGRLFVCWMDEHICIAISGLLMKEDEGALVADPRRR